MVVAVACPDKSLAPTRRVMGRLVLPGQRSIHMKHESARRRNRIAETVNGLHHLGLRAIILDAGRGPEPERIRRDRALQALVNLARREPVVNLVLDLDQSLVARDARTLASAIRRANTDSITYSHQSLASQPLLSLPDVIAWCWARGGDWRRRVASITTTTLDV